MAAENDGSFSANPLTKEFLQYGGQAVIEGVMMRSPHHFAVACRKPNGEIVTQCEVVDKGILGKLKWLNKPFLRGTLALIDAMALGMRALAFASNVQMEAEQELQTGKLLDMAPRHDASVFDSDDVSPASGDGTADRTPAEEQQSRKVDDSANGGTTGGSSDVKTAG